jgi:transmembrane sensor
MSLWARYGQRVGGLDELTSRRIERRLLEQLETPRAPRVRRWAIVAVGLAAVLLLAIGRALVAPLARDPEPSWVAISTTTRAQEVSLPHAGSLRVGLDSRVELAASDAAGAVVRLHEGEVTLQVHAGEGLRWRVEVDVYRVEALGTRFRVRRTEGVPDVHVDEGVVALSGPGQPEGGLLIRAVEPVVAEREDGQRPAHAVAEPVAASYGYPAAVEPDSPADIELGPMPEEPAGDASALDPSPDDPGGPAAGFDEPVASEPALDRPSSPRWVERFRDAIAAGDDTSAVAALPAGFPSGRESLTSSDYLDAGDALASRHDAARADAAYRAACRRTRAPACGVATFRRALMADRGGETAAAIRLATRYLEDHPDGSLVPEVLARRMRWQSAAGKPDAARRDARSYLARWPDGPHEDLARRILGERAGAP